MNEVAVKNALTVDVEDYFHVSAFKDSIGRDDWDSLESRVERNTDKILGLFDDASVNATFFVLGWVAERFPGLVQRIVGSGHELACHGYSHQLIYTQNPDVFREETIRAKKLLEDNGGVSVAGYRAASYSITNKSAWAVDTLIDAGFEYDSSIVPVRHDLYGMAGAGAYPYRLANHDGRSIVEFPPSTLSLAGQRIQIAGGGYFRLFPYWFSKWGMGRINRHDRKPFAFYMHPWEVDPNQPRIKASAKSRFRHYNNLHKFEPRLVKLLHSFRFDTMRSVLADMPLESVALAADGPGGN